MLDNCLISVCIPVYNQEQYIAEAINSVLSQTYRNFELIISDNCSTDSTAEIIESFIDPRIRFFRQPTNIGMVSNFNFVTNQANGDFIKYVCGDDVLYPDCIEKLYSDICAHDKVVIVACRREITSNKYNCENEIYGYFTNRQAIQMILTSGNFIGEPSVVLVRREYAQKRQFDTYFRQLLDVDFYLGLLQYGDLFITSEVLSLFRIHDEQATNQNLNDESLITSEFDYLIDKNVDLFRSNNLLLSKYIVHAIKRNKLWKAFLLIIKKPTIIFLIISNKLNKVASAR